MSSLFIFATMSSGMNCLACVFCVTSAAKEIGCSEKSIYNLLKQIKKGGKNEFVEGTHYIFQHTKKHKCLFSVRGLIIVGRHIRPYKRVKN